MLERVARRRRPMGARVHHVMVVVVVVCMFWRLDTWLRNVLRGGTIPNRRRSILRDPRSSGLRLDQGSCATTCAPSWTKVRAPGLGLSLGDWWRGACRHEDVTQRVEVQYSGW